MASVLTILFQKTSDEALRLASRQGDVLAVTPLGMAQCEQLTIAYLTLDDYVSLDELRRLTFDFYGALLELCIYLDTTVEGPCAAYNSYRAVCYPLYSAMSVARIVSTLMESISVKHEKFYLEGAPSFVPLEDSVSPKMSDHWATECFESSLKLFAKLVCATPTCAGVTYALPPQQNGWAHVWGRVRPFLSRVKRYVYERISPGERTDPAAPRILVSSEHYGISALRSAMPDVELVQIDRALNFIDQHQEHVDSKVPDRVVSFAEQWFPQYGKHFVEYFRNYHRDVIQGIPRLSAAIDTMVASVSPSAMIVSNGFLSNVLNICAKVCSKRGIPVLSHQHGGILLHKVPNDFELETRPDLNAVWLYQGRLDAEGNPNAPRHRIGNIMAWEIANKSPQSNDRILCVQGPNAFSFFGYVDLSDKMKHDSIKSVLNACRKQDVKLDIKAHVIDADHNVPYYSTLMSGGDFGFVRLISQGVIEPLLHRYPLIIISVVGSLPSTLVLGRDVPVILHAPSADDIRQDALEPYLDRVYFSRTEEELGDLLQLFKQGRLSAKNVERAREEFLWPTEGPNPVERLASYLQTLLPEQGAGS